MAAVMPVAPAVPTAAAQVLGANLFQKSYLRNNLKATLEASMALFHSSYSGDFATCDLAAFAHLKNYGTPGNFIEGGEILIIPCLSRLTQGDRTALQKNGILTSLHNETPDAGHEPLWVTVDGKADLKLMDHVGIYIILVDKCLESEPADDVVHIYGRLITTLPPIEIIANGPILEKYVCNPFFIPGSDVVLSVRINSSCLVANSDLRAELTQFEGVSPLTKRSATSTLNSDVSVKPSARNAAGFIMATNDGRLLQIYDKGTHDKGIQLTQALLRLLWSTPAKRVAFFGAYDHRYDSNVISEAVSAAYVATENGPEWKSISYYPTLQKLRVFQDPVKLEKCLCWKATAADHNVFSASHLLPFDVTPFYGSNDHYHLFASFKNLGTLLAVMIHSGYDKLFDATEDTIRTNPRLCKVPDFVLAYVFVIVLESIGKELNDMTMDSASPEWETDRNRGVLLIQRHAAKFFTVDYCVRVHDDWSILHKDNFIPWSESSSLVSGSAAVNVPTVPVAAKGGGDYCLRDIKHFFTFIHKGKPSPACTGVGCKLKHLVVGNAPNKDAINRWIMSVKGNNGTPTQWRLDLVTLVKNF
jgi:hypothetical protein